HSEEATEFKAGKFTAQKTKKVFFSIPNDKANEHNDALIKGDVGVVCLTDNSSAICRWMIAGPEVSRVIEEFQDGNRHRERRADTCNHDQTASVENAFDKDVHSFANLIEDLRNPIEEGYVDLVSSSQEITGPVAIKAIRKPYAPATTSIFLDGAAIIQMLKPAADKNFNEYASQIFIPYLSRMLQNLHRLEIVSVGVLQMQEGFCDAM
ncbi:hypothetical protein Hamer_G011772, partial [Homarus americanus]